MITLIIGFVYLLLCYILAQISEDTSIVPDMGKWNVSSSEKDFSVRLSRKYQKEQQKIFFKYFLTLFIFLIFCICSFFMSLQKSKFENWLIEILIGFGSYLILFCILIILHAKKKIAYLFNSSSFLIRNNKWENDFEYFVSYSDRLKIMKGQSSFLFRNDEGKDSETVYEIYFTDINKEDLKKLELFLIQNDVFVEYSKAEEESFRKRQLEEKNLFVNMKKIISRQSLLKIETSSFLHMWKMIFLETLILFLIPFVSVFREILAVVLGVCIAILELTWTIVQPVLLCVGAILLVIFLFGIPLICLVGVVLFVRWVWYL